MYQPENAKPIYNQPPSAAASGFPVSINSNTSAAASGFPVSINNNTSASATSVYGPPKPPVEWSTGLCDCCSNPGNCCCTYCCPCITFGRVAEIIDKGSTSCCVSGTCYVLLGLFGCGWVYSCCNRSKMRQQYGLKGNDCTDCMVHCCCGACALCQEYRELENRGFNMAIGWHGNVEQRTRGIAMATTAPAVESGMNR